MNDTIYGLATVAGRSAIAVVRLSGLRAHAALAALTNTRLPPIRTTAVRTLVSSEGVRLDQCLALRWCAPDSFTGEDVVELHLHGGVAVVDAVLQELDALGLRPSQPGEFTRRAFEHGKLSLVEAEAIADLVDAESEAQRVQALEQLGGALDRRYADWRAALLRCLSRVAATIDFPDEDLPQDIIEDLRLNLQGLRNEWTKAVSDDRGRKIRDGFRIAIVGLPNAGKSSLLNGVVGRDVAIVAPVEGTTRDIIEIPVILGGYRVLLADMAGIRETGDPIEQEGVRRARVWAGAADLRIFLRDLTRLHVDDPTVELAKSGDWLIATKADLVGEDVAPELQFMAGWTGRLDTRCQADLEVLRNRLVTFLSENLGGRTFPAVTRSRHRNALLAGVAALDRAIVGLGENPELVGEDLRLAARALEKVVGRIDSEMVLDEVFSSFCIGK